MQITFWGWAALAVIVVLTLFIMLQRKRPEQADALVSDGRGFLSRLWARIRGR